MQPVPFRSVPWWIYVIAGSFLLYFALKEIQTLTGPAIGIYASNTRSGTVFSGVVPNSAAAAAGIQPGDRLLSVDGRKITSRGDWLALQTNLTSEHPTTMEIARAGQLLNVTFTLQRTSWSNRRLEERVSHIVARSGQLIMLALACFVAFARPRDGVALMGGLVFAILAVTDTQQPTGSAAAWRTLPAIIGALLWIPVLGQTLANPFLFTFCATFPRKLIQARWIWALIWTPAIVSSAVFVHFGYYVVYDPDHAIGLLQDRTMEALTVPHFGYFIGAIVAMAANYRRLSDINERRRVRVLVLGVVIGLSPAVPWLLLLLLGSQEGLLPNIFKSVPYLIVSMVLIYWFLPLSFAYSVLRHRLFDIRIIVRQGLQYAMARRVLLSILPALVAFLLLDLVTHSDQSLASILKLRGWFYAGFGGLAALVYRKRQIWLNEIDCRFFRDHYDAQRLLRDVIEEVKEARSLGAISVSVLGRIQTALHPEFVALLRHDKDEGDHRIAACMPAGHPVPQLRPDGKLVQLLRLAGKPLQLSSATEWLSGERGEYKDIELLVPIDDDSLLVFGPKRSEEPYSREDENLLSTIAASLAMLSAKSPSVSVEAETAPRRLMNRYRLDECIGRGGMGAVYSGFDEALDRPVAIKLIRQDLAADSDMAARFRQEAKAAAGIAHRNVVTVYDFGVERQQPFLVMELLAGRTLRTELDAEKILPPERTLEILIPVCDAIEEAHGRRLIHRDLKPENIFLVHAPSGEVVKVLDFGLAKLLIVANLSNAPTATAIVGTPYYMAPEQLMGESPNVSWDLWALAVIAHEMLTGQRPSLGDTPARNAPPRSQQFFKQTLNPDPTRRLGSIQAFRSELQAALSP